MLKRLVGASILALWSCSAAAQIPDPILEVTFTGTVSASGDDAGIFYGGPKDRGANIGKRFTLLFMVDMGRGHRSISGTPPPGREPTGPWRDTVEGGPDYFSTPPSARSRLSPTHTAVIDVEGRSYTIDATKSGKAELRGDMTESDKYFISATGGGRDRFECRDTGRANAPLPCIFVTETIESAVVGLDSTGWTVPYRLDHQLFVDFSNISSGVTGTLVWGATGLFFVRRLSCVSPPFFGQQKEQTFQVPSGCTQDDTILLLKVETAEVKPYHFMLPETYPFPP